MSLNRFSLLAVTALALVPFTSANAAPGGMLVETRLSDPDPGYVPPPAERGSATKQHSAKDPTLDEAMENLGRVAGQAAQIMQQRAVDRMIQTRAASEPPKN